MVTCTHLPLHIAKSYFGVVFDIKVAFCHFLELQSVTFSGFVVMYQYNA